MYLFTSESVTEGHPDKICDQISDAILDNILSVDPNARVACETSVTTGLILIAGEITTTAHVDFSEIARETVKEIGYDRGKYGFDAENAGVIVSVHKQSPDIAMGVDKENQGAGDQGIMFGYATNETDEYMPLPILLAHKLTHQLTKVRKNGILKYLRPDGKSQVTVAYNDDKSISHVDTIVISAQHDPDVSQEQIKKDVIQYVVGEVIDPAYITNETKYHINPTGQFIIGGPKGDAGLTGRKIIVDTYGGKARHGGGAFSGKDASKVDRSATYAARHVAKNVVAAGLADELEIQISYAIGIAEPISIFIDTFGTNKVSEDVILTAIKETFDLRPKAIIDSLDLKKPVFKETASYGHFGRAKFSWEQLNKVDDLKKYL